MKKKIILTGVICISVISMAFGKMYVKADEPKSVQSHGNVIVENAGIEPIALYASDIHYLRAELKRLTDEMRPDVSTDENNNIPAEED